MNLHRMAVIATLAAALSVITVAPAAAEEFKPGATIRNILTDSMGKRVGVRLDSREELEGTVTSVGEHLVLISKLSGRDYFDAYVSIERITAVIVKTR